jgi:hypothetical protein
MKSISRTGEEDIDDCLEILNLRDVLEPRQSPFCIHNNFGGGFVSEDDRVALSSIHFGSTESSGATDMCRPRSQGSDIVDDVRCSVLLCPALLSFGWSMMVVEQVSISG